MGNRSRIIRGMAQPLVAAVLATTTVAAQRAMPPTRSHHPGIPYQPPAALAAIVAAIDSAR